MNRAPLIGFIAGFVLISAVNFVFFRPVPQTDSELRSRAAELRAEASRIEAELKKES